MHPVEDIGISPWPVDVVEFGADAYTHRKQLYNQVPQTAWVSQFEFEFQLEFESVGGQDAGWESACRLMAWTLSNPRLSSPAKMRKKCCYGQNNFGSIYGSLSPSPTHTQPTSTLSNKVWEVYFYKDVCSFVHWSSYIIVDYISAYIYIYV